MSDNPPLDWDPREASVLREQRQTYDTMREQCPVAHSDFLNWSIFRHEDIVNILADPETFSSASKYRAVPNGMDPPEHTVYRRLLEPFFREDQMAAFEPRCRRIASNMVQALIDREDVEFVSEFAEPFALQSLCEFLGWPRDTWEHLRGWTHGNQRASLSRDGEAGAALAHEFAGYVNDAIEVRRSAGADETEDITSTLMATEVNGEPLSDEVIVSALRNWTAGHGTVSAALGIVALYLAEHDDVQSQLRSDPGLLHAAIDEILRADSPLVANRRTTTREVEIGGRTIGAGEKLTLMWIAANRDGLVFDNPEEVRFHSHRETNLHDRAGANLLYGAGIHDCIGAPLARLELRVAIEELLAATSRIELAGTQAPKRAVYPSNGLESMQIRLR